MARPLRENRRTAAARESRGAAGAGPLRVKLRRDPSEGTAVAGEFAAEARRFARLGKQFGNISDAWLDLAPEGLRDEVRFEAFGGGVLSVVVPSSSTSYALDRALRAGLLAALRSAVKGPLLRVKIRVGAIDSEEPRG